MCWSAGSTRRSASVGPVVTLVTNVWLFGTWGLAMWLFEMAWIPFFAAGVINGLGHWWGYRNFETPDESRNLPGQFWSILTCGEALHNNHHHIQNSPRFAMRRASSIRATGISARSASSAWPASASTRRRQRPS